MHPKIRYFALYLFCKADPFVALHRGSGDNEIVRFYPLTKASAWRLAGVSQVLPGHHTVSGQGWSWTRA